MPEQLHVTRIPPGYGHTGKLYWFDKDGDLKQVGRTRSGSGAEAESPEAAALSEKEFAELIQEMGEQAMTRGKISDAIGKVFPGVSDHSCTTYVELIHEQVKLADSI